MTTRNYRFNLATGLIIEGGYFTPVCDPAVEGFVSLVDDSSAHPDPRTVRASVAGFRPATATEIAAFDAASADAQAQNDIDTEKKIRSAVITSLWGRLGRQPTAAEIQAERSRFVTVYKNI
jgi:hypothetical protein